MAEQQTPPGFKQISLDKIIEAMTLEGSSGHYVQFGVNPQQATSHNWGDYASGQSRHHITGQPTHSNHPSGMQTITPMTTSLYMQDMPSYDTTATDSIYYPPQTVNHLGINENNDLIGTIDVGGGNYINVIYGNASQLMAEQCQLPNMTPYSSQNIVNQEYGLFNDQHLSVSPDMPSQNFNGKQLIENLVGNWVPNQSGTYSPFGGSPNVTPAPQPVPDKRDLEELPRNTSDSQYKKPRMVAEVKPMRPSYSDVLTKSAPAPPSPLTVQPTKPKVEVTGKKISNKNTKNKNKPASLKRQNSSGSDDHNSPKMQIPKKVLEKNSSNLPRRWVSLDNLGSQSDSRQINAFDRSDQFTSEKKKPPVKPLKKTEKNETLNNIKTQNSNSKITGNIPKRPIQINNNLNTINTSSQTVPSEKVEKNQQIINKISKEDKKAVKEKNSKRFQAEKAQQIKKGQRNRRRENRESPVKDLYKNLNKYATRWSKVVLKIFYWLLHLISDVVSMSANLVVQLGKCAWYHILVYLKCWWVYMAVTFCKIRILNIIGKQLDSWLGSTKFAFWRKINIKKNEEKDGNWIRGGLESNIALPSTGEEAMKRLLACKGKDPYSILGVTPTCSDDDIKKYYKRQAFLVHPDKNNQPGAEEAFKILERRQAFDQTRQVEAAWSELSDLLSQLQRKMEQAANTIRCTNCGLRHKRVPTQRPCYAARFCAQCKIRHSAKEGDIWAESRLMGFLWHYYACMEGAVYDVTDWAACQAGNLKHLRANTHSVQYRIVLGQRLSSQTSVSGRRRQQIDPNTSEADFEDFLNNLYNHSQSANSNPLGDQNSFRGDSRRRKTKRKK
ncbi:dnaJ homolog dnj-5 isoform X2 [Pseudomyrmex gracilis]|uniref:dnaJ homolog dnj-5 isoform X2 n=1 Tax=Pseudomyrmex gracilis TaxID=219809 RepID=UPI000995D4B0|nr:dnaJ homolog dnj-5 isoform X2 [Pseudomyrmex gracilis]